MDIKPALRNALIAAIPLEAFSFIFGGYAMDVGLEGASSPITRLFGYIFIALHYPGLSLSGLESDQLSLPIILVTGYVMSALLLSVFFVGGAWLLGSIKHQRE